MLFLLKLYKDVNLITAGLLNWSYHSLSLLNSKVMVTWVVSLLGYSPNKLKAIFYILFFKDFLTWNYLLNSNVTNSNKYLKVSDINPKTSSARSGTYKGRLTTVLSMNTTLNSILFYVNIFISEMSLAIKVIVYKSFSFSWYYINGFVFILFIDACLTDDEPLWEPIEWSLVQTWILFIFSFAWIAENLIVSRYGSYAGRDKRVWMAWYKTFWLIEGYYVLNYGVAVVLVIVPFYFELNYNLSFIYSWWNWFSRVFFYKFTLFYTIILLISFWLQVNVRWVGFKKALFLISLVNIMLAYLLYTHFIIIFFGYFTDPIWYQKNSICRLCATKSWTCKVGLRVV
jgi:hypothetical protein